MKVKNHNIQFIDITFSSLHRLPRVLTVYVNTFNYAEIQISHAVLVLPDWTVTTEDMKGLG